MNVPSIIIFLGITILIIIVSNASAGLSPEDLEKLGTVLTPLGGEKAGNANGTIPSWNGGLTKPPSAYVEGEHYTDPFPEDEILFTITGENKDQYRDNLSAGHQAMLGLYSDSFKMHVYETRRTAAAPQRIYDATRKAAATARLTDDGNGVHGAVIGIPFPIPNDGLEVIWNHILRWRADKAARTIAQAAPTRRGAYTLVKFEDQFDFNYAHEGVTEQGLNNIIIFFKQKVVAPARLAGGILLVHETLDQSREHRKAWLYNTGQRRVRRAPNVAFDNPGTAADGQRTTDQFDMYNGSPQRYDWKLMGKQEVYVPYNNYRLQNPKLKYNDILKPLHINPEYPRYELHRVWVVEATLKDGARHIYKRRTFYLDEDSWQVLLVDQYDNRDQLWRVSEGFAMNYYNVPNLWTTLEVHTDLQSGRYLAIGLDNEYRPYRFNVKLSPRDFTPSALRRDGRR
ncbi:MAG: DUF1329 domain-containing protein [Pseudomonadota bacterium]